MRYIPTFGLEIHSQLATKTKIFCGCSTEFGNDSNSQSCEVCLGMPGVLPVLNRRAVELAVRMALYTGGEVQKRSSFARKNYFYPDLPKGYQISMFEQPLIRGGKVVLDTSRGPKTIRLNRIHLEEDAGKLIHVEGGAESFFDANRCGVPLIEIVTEPDFETEEEVSLFLNILKEMLIFAHASNGNMEQGNIRVDTNISIRPEGQTELGTRTEIKNMNSFVNVAAAIRLEIDRQTDILERGGKIVQETLLYDAVKNTVSAMRSKEEAHDYRYFRSPISCPWSWTTSGSPVSAPNSPNSDLSCARVSSGSTVFRSMTPTSLPRRRTSRPIMKIRSARGPIRKKHPTGSWAR